MCAVVLGLASGLLLVEVLLRWRTAHIVASDDLTPGLVSYHSTLGWRLTPGWSGEHKQYDFRACYRVNWEGFRADVEVPSAFKAKRYAVVGDSFTFGLGVNDNETFSHLLNEKKTPQAFFLNCAMPGYSTDQEALLIEAEILRTHPDEILLVIYLANDLLDNQFPVPIQVRAAKPYFEIGPGGLVLKDNPVPREIPPGLAHGPTLMAAVLGEEALQRSLRMRLEGRSEVFKLLSQYCLPSEDHTAEFDTRFYPALRISKAILERTASDCARAKVKLTLVLLAGRSFVEEPTSLSAQYQDYFRQRLLDFTKAQGYRTIDVAAQMRSRRSTGRLFYPHEGHLTPAGHRVVAELLGQELLK